MTNIWDQPLQALFPKKVPALVNKLNQAGLCLVGDLLWHLPTKTEHIPSPQPFSSARVGQLFQGQGKVINVQNRPIFGRKSRGRLLLHQVQMCVRDQHGSELLLVWFNCYPSARDKIKLISEISFLGIPQLFGSRLQLANPEYSSGPGALFSAPAMRQVYPTVQGVSTEKIRELLEKIPLSEWDRIVDLLPLNILEKRNLPSLKVAFQILHGKIQANEQSKAQACQRLIYEEFFRNQMKIFVRKQRQQQQKSLIIKIENKELGNYIKLFPYSLTEGQLSSLEAILGDLKKGHPMNRLIQGDVGSGKTTVAFLTAAIIIHNHGQVAMMCPTEALALQHYQTATTVFAQSSIKIGLLLGSTPNKEKKELLQLVEKGEIDFIIGTHALIQEKVIFKKLILAIIDEQHRFGVEQRHQLISKGSATHGLIMTATPIPRSLELTQYGDLDISSIRQLPTGRKGVSTRIVTPEMWSKFFSFLKTRILMGEQAYIVVPAIEDNPDLDLMALEKVNTKFKQLFPEFRQSTLHGRLPAQEKSEILNRFQAGDIQMLISTSVVEVGINVTNASIMAILNPERFGLSSLHQLRGRVGRGHLPGFCFLVVDKQLSQQAMERLSVIERTIDGFIIAEEDLRSRGAGQLFGKGQSGHLSDYKIADPVTHQARLLEGRCDLEELIKLKYSPIVQELSRLIDNKLISSTV